MSDPVPFHPQRYLAPRYWLTWVGLAVLRLTSLLPYRLQLLLGSLLGELFYWLVPSRRRIAEINLHLCFPELSATERSRLARRSFHAVATSLFEAGLSWWASERRMARLHQIVGLEHLEEAQRQGKGVILLGGHYTTLEISGRFLAQHNPDIQPIYKPARNALFNAVMVSGRTRHLDDLLLNSDMRTILRALKGGKVVWYAPDQDFGPERSVFAPFFGVPTATLTTTARLAKLSGAPVVPYYSERLPGGEGFVIRVLPALTDFPSGDDVADAARTNQIIEQQARRVPEQYLWVHRRFKTRPQGDADPYRRAA